MRARVAPIAEVVVILVMLVEIRNRDAVVGVVEHAVAVGVDGGTSVDSGVDLDHRVGDEAGVSAEPVDAPLVARTRGLARHARRHSRRIAGRETDEEHEPHHLSRIPRARVSLSSYVLERMRRAYRVPAETLAGS